MRIAIDARIIFTSTGRYIERLVEHLQRIDHDNEYLVLLTDADFDRWQPSAPNFRKVRANFRPFTLSEQLGYAVFLYRLRCDLVHFTQVHYPLLYVRRHVTTVHDLTLVDYINKRREGLVKDLYKHHVKPAVFKFVMWWTLKFSAHILTPTEFVRAELIKRYRISKLAITATHEATDPLTDTPIKPAYIEPSDTYLMFLGNAFIYKNVWFLVEAFGRLNRPGLKLVLCGKKEYFYTELEERTKAAGIANVIFAGFVPDENAAWLYAHATLFVHPSLSEGFCIPLLEAMHYGAPVLASNASCLPEVCGDAAAYFDPTNSDELVAKLTELLDHPEARQQLITAGHQRENEFSWSTMAEQTLSVYQQSAPKNAR